VPEDFIVVAPQPRPRRDVDRDRAAWLYHTSDIREHGNVVIDVLEHVEGEYQVETVIGQW